MKKVVEGVVFRIGVDYSRVKPKDCYEVLLRNDDGADIALLQRLLDKFIGRSVRVTVEEI